MTQSTVRNRNQNPAAKAPGRSRPISFRQVLGFAWSYWRRFPLTVFGLFVSLLAATATAVIQPFLAGKFVDSVANTDGTIGPASVILAVFMASVVLNLGFRQLHDRLWVRLSTRVMSRITTDAFARVQRFSTRWHTDSFAGATVRKITRGMWAFDVFGNTLFYGFIPMTAMLLGAIAVLGTQWPIMGVLIIVAVAAYAVIIYRMARYYIAPANRDFVAQDSRVGAVLSDAVTCNATVKSFGAEAREDARLCEAYADWQRKAGRTWIRSVNAGAAQSAILIALQGGLLCLALWFWAHGQATPGQITMVFTTYLILNVHLRDMGMHMRGLQQAMNDLEDVVRFKTMAPGITDRPGAVALVPDHGRIVFDRVSFSYEDPSLPVYDQFSLTIEAGERVALVGESGSGKSTFVKLLQRLYDVDTGEIRIDGQNIAAVTQESLRRSVALVPQEPVLFHRSLAENISYARPGATQPEIEWAARLAHAHEFITRLPAGYDTLVGERGLKLSGGERQRVAIARAFLSNAPILILDEATSSLDSITEDYIQEAMHTLMEGRTTILIAHRLSTIQAADRILVFAGGRIVEQGSHLELIAQHGYYWYLHQTQYGRQAQPIAV